MDADKIKKMKACVNLLPPPGGEVVMECLTEIERLKEELADERKAVISCSTQCEYWFREIERLKEENERERECKASVRTNDNGTEPMIRYGCKGPYLWYIPESKFCPFCGGTVLKVKDGGSDAF